MGAPYSTSVAAFFMTTLPHAGDDPCRAVDLGLSYHYTGQCAEGTSSSKLAVVSAEPTRVGCTSGPDLLTWISGSRVHHESRLHRIDRQPRRDPLRRPADARRRNRARSWCASAPPPSTRSTSTSAPARCPMPLPIPFILGCDLAGTVEAVGPGGDALQGRATACGAPTRDCSAGRARSRSTPRFTRTGSTRRRPA